jgi:hypothetical protein
MTDPTDLDTPVSEDPAPEVPGAQAKPWLDPDQCPWRDDDLITPAVMAGLFLVDPKTVTRWAKSGRIPYVPDDPRPTVIRTPGGHIRIRFKVVRMILDGEIEMHYADTTGRSIPATPGTRR